jgi:hypothetical protein
MPNVRNFHLFSLCCIYFLDPTSARSQEKYATSKIVAVDLFKNGLCVVKREATLGKPGTYLLSDVPQPIHGTYWGKARCRWSLR